MTGDIFGHHTLNSFTKKTHHALPLSCNFPHSQNSLFVNITTFFL
nr:MAG TPA: hypothetical protein [Caudoviricetes sp.]